MTTNSIPLVQLQYFSCVPNIYTSFHPACQIKMFCGNRINKIYSIRALRRTSEYLLDHGLCIWPIRNLIFRLQGSVLMIQGINSSSLSLVTSLLGLQVTFHVCLWNLVISSDSSPLFISPAPILLPGHCSFLFARAKLASISHDVQWTWESYTSVVCGREKGTWPKLLSLRFRLVEKFRPYLSQTSKPLPSLAPRKS